MRITDKYVFFYGGALSQWHKVPIFYREIMFNCAEQAMMYHKAMLFNDTVTAQKILDTDSPKAQKALGRKVTPFNPKEWSRMSRLIVLEINYAKFSQHEDLKELLLSTGYKILVEASPFDKVWGIGRREGTEGIEDQKNWNGKNWLGYCLSDVKHMLQNGHTPHLTPRRHYD